jgi:indole-3-glycerol phosphate synthase
MLGTGFEMSILTRIIENKKEEIIVRKKTLSLEALMGRPDYDVEARDFHRALAKPGLSVIAEVKKASPSRGVISGELNPGVLATAYETAGADAISVLTDNAFFSGGLDDLVAVKAVTSIPVLRKDFIIDEFQIHEAKAYGADAVLLIASLHSLKTLSYLIDLCESIGLSALVEAHTEEAVAGAISAGADIIGLNNRDLNTFEVDMAVTERLMNNIRQGILTVSESGISGRKEAGRAKMAGVDALLVGEALVVAEDIEQKIADLKMAGHDG